MKPLLQGRTPLVQHPAAFRRLCVETRLIPRPSSRNHAQPPSGGCVLKQLIYCHFQLFEIQPPSGGCVLKLQQLKQQKHESQPAAFRRLCVETNNDIVDQESSVPAAFRRLCVETFSVAFAICSRVPAAFRRLCVETTGTTERNTNWASSRLQAAVC